jgi:hypothetical protein
VIGVLILVAVSIGVAILQPRTQPAPDLTTPEGVVLAYALAVQRGDPEAAWELLSSSARNQTTRERFLARAAGLSGTYARARLSVEDVRVDGDAARVELVRTYRGESVPFPFGSGGTYHNRNTVRLVREEGMWRMSTPPEPFLLERIP